MALSNTTTLTPSSDSREATISSSCGMFDGPKILRGGMLNVTLQYASECRNNSIAPSLPAPFICDPLDLRLTSNCNEKTIRRWYWQRFSMAEGDANGLSFIQVTTGAPFSGPGIRTIELDQSTPLRSITSQCCLLSSAQLRNT